MRKQALISFPAVVISVLLTGCSGSDSSKSSSPAFPKEFPAVTVPQMITDQVGYYDFLTLHFWDRYLDSASVWCEYDDSTRTGGVSSSVLRSEYSEYAGALWNVPVKDALSAQCRLMDRLEKAALADTAAVPIFEEFCALAENCLYGVNSDFRNEEFYIPVLEKMIRTPLRSAVTVDVLKDKYREELAGCSRNRIGEVAADFDYSTASGQVGSLHQIDAELILLFFSNPGCSACLEIINSLKGSVAVSSLVSSGRLKVLNIYIDEDLTEWFKYMPVYPGEWINACQPDLQVRREGIYDVRAIPSLYILDRDKRVVFKDVTPSVALSYLEYQAVEQ